jgi:hypothetical protein
MSCSSDLPYPPPQERLPTNDICCRAVCRRSPLTHCPTTYNHHNHFTDTCRNVPSTLRARSTWSDERCRPRHTEHDVQLPTSLTSTPISDTTPPRTSTRSWHAQRQRPEPSFDIHPCWPLELESLRSECASKWPLSW